MPLTAINDNALGRYEAEGADFVATAESLTPWKDNDNACVHQRAAPFKLR